MCFGLVPSAPNGSAPYESGCAAVPGGLPRRTSGLPFRGGLSSLRRRYVNRAGHRRPRPARPPATSCARLPPRGPTAVRASHRSAPVGVLLAATARSTAGSRRPLARRRRARRRHRPEIESTPRLYFDHGTAPDLGRRRRQLRPVAPPLCGANLARDAAAARVPRSCHSSTGCQVHFITPASGRRRQLACSPFSRLAEAETCAGIYRCAVASRSLRAMSTRHAPAGGSADQVGPQKNRRAGSPMRVSAAPSACWRHAALGRAGRPRAGLFESARCRASTSDSWSGLPRSPIAALSAPRAYVAAIAQRHHAVAPDSDIAGSLCGRI